MANPRQNTPAAISSASKLPPRSQIGKFSALGFLGFCAAFALVASLLDTDAPAYTPSPVPSEWPYDDPSPDSSSSSASSNRRDPPTRDSSPSLPTQDPTEPLDHFNRRFHHRTPWILKRVASTSEAQQRVAERQSVAQQRADNRLTRQETQKQQQDAAKRRQAEIDRFTESRRMANEGLVGGMGGLDTPRGRGSERVVAGGMRQRSSSSASDYSASSYDSF